MHLRAVRLCLPLTCLLLAGLDATAQKAWVGTWAAAPSAAAQETGALPSQTTLREIVHLSRGGSTVRVTFSNELGTESLSITGAHVGLSTGGNSVNAGSDRPLSFGGQASVIIPAGAVAVSDAVDLKVAAQSDLAITLVLPPQPLHVITAHWLALQTSYQATGDQLAATSLPDAAPLKQWRFLKNVEVGSTGGAAIVTFGNSITDGYNSTPDTNRRWPDVLAARLQADKKLSELGVLNEGISGNRLLHDGAGPNALARFDRDVLSQSGVRYLVLLEGINDIGRTDKPEAATDPITVPEILLSYSQMIDRAHAHGIKVYGATLTPFVGAGYASDAGETMRQAVNTWIRTSGRFDGVIDFDQVTRDAARPSVMSPAADSGDHLHPSDAGYKTMGNSIDLKLFRP